MLVALLGGVSMGALVAARRTQSSFATYLASTNPSNLDISVFGGTGSGGGSAPLYSSAAVRAISHLPFVTHVEAAIPVAAAPLAPDGAPILRGISDIQPVASVDGLFFDQDRLAVIAGRMADPDDPHEIVMTQLAARLLGVYIGEVVRYGVYSLDQQAMPGFGTAKVQPELRLSVTVVGLVQQSNALVQDDIDRFPTFVFFTPAMGRKVVAADAQEGAISYGLQLEHGNASVSAAEREFADLVPPGNTYGFHAVAPVEDKVDQTVKPVAIALAVFGGIAGLAAVLIALQLIVRDLQALDQDLAVMRALGAEPAANIADALIGILVSIVIGSLFAGLVGLALSPLSPLGPVRAVYPGGPVAADWTVLGLGVLALVVVLGAVAFVVTYRSAPHRAAARAERAAPRASRTVDLAASAGLPPPAVVGVHFALESGRRGTRVPMRSALLGAILAVALVVATLTFGSGLRSLVAQPALYGWDFSYMLDTSNTAPPYALSLLDHDADVAGWEGYDYNVVEVDRQAVPFLFEDARSATKEAISPPILSGHALEGKGQIVLGAATLAQLHKHIGERVTVSYGAPQNPVYVPPTSLVVVGTATMPAVGFSSVIDDHTSMGTGALMSIADLPTSFQEASSSSDPELNGPNLVFVRLRQDVPQAAGLASLQRIATETNRWFSTVPDSAAQGATVSVVAVQRPAEIVNEGTVGSSPALLAAALAVGAVVALALTLVASVRRRRRDIALLKTLGFIRRQLVSALAWQVSLVGAVGVVIGIPLGIAVGRWLWVLFARQIYAVPKPSVPVASVALVALGALLLANVVATLPGLIAARTPAAHLLRGE